MSSVLEKEEYMKKLEEAIKEGKSKIILPEYQDQISDAEILGVLVSKFSKWDINKIVEILEYTLEDSNFKLKDLKEYL